MENSIRAILESKGLSILPLEKLAGIPYSVFQKAELDYARPRITLAKIATILDVKPECLLAGEGGFYA